MRTLIKAKHLGPRRAAPLCLIGVLLGLSTTVAYAVDTVHIGRGGTGLSVESDDGQSVRIGPDGSVRVTDEQGTVGVRSGAGGARNSDVRINSDGTGPGATVGPGAGAIMVTESHRTETMTCSNGTPVVISGNDNMLTFIGDCGGTVVNGDKNFVKFDVVAAITTNGNRNRVTWQSGNPPVTNLGNGNSHVAVTR